MPQGKAKSAIEKQEIRVMLPNINLLYLGCSVLILLDLSYLSRFWTQFEAYLSLRRATVRGLTDASPEQRRVTIRCMYNKQPAMERMLIDTWAHKNLHEAHEYLARPDVIVTNESDKEQQLLKLWQLDEFAQRLFGTSGLLLVPHMTAPSPARSAAPAPAVVGDSYDIFISLRFGEGMEQGTALLQQLQARGIRVFICDVAPGGDIRTVIAEALDSCRLAVILATETYGVTTNGMFDTCKELAFIVSEKKPVSGLSFAHTQTLS